MKERVICIFANGNRFSLETGEILKAKLEKSGFKTTGDFHPEAELIVCIGGDGSFLQAVHRLDFPRIPFIGINTGHLGFFQEILPNQLDDFIFHYKQNKYHIQHLSTVKVIGQTSGGEEILHILLAAEVQLLVGTGDDIGIALALQFPHDGAAHHAAMPGYIDLCVFLHHNCIFLPLQRGKIWSVTILLM